MKIIAIGPLPDFEHHAFTGQSVMFNGLVTELVNHGYQIKIIDISSRFKKNSFITRCIDYIWVISKILLTLLFNKYDLAYLTTSQSKRGFLRDFAITKILNLFRVKIIAHQFGANYRQLTDNLNKTSMTRLKRMLDIIPVVIVEGDYMKSQFSFYDDFEKKLKVIPNGLPLEGENVCIPKSYDGIEPFRMFYLSNMIQSKGYFDVLKSLDILRNQYHLNVTCVFAGKFISSVDDSQPFYKDDFYQYIIERHLEDAVSYYPGLYGKEKDLFFCKSNVFLLPTYYINEGQPVSVVEALAYGCVPIVTRYRHIPMMVNNNNGCFVNPRSPREIADSIRFLMEHKDAYEDKSMNCIKDYQGYFKFDCYIERIMNCFDSVAS